MNSINTKIIFLFFSTILLVFQIRLPSAQIFWMEPSNWLTSEDFLASGIFSSGSVNYTITRGEAKPNTMISVSINPNLENAITFDRTFLVYGLIEIDEEGNLIEQVYWEIDDPSNVTVSNGRTWNMRLPPDFPAIYKYGLICWRGNESIGKLVSTIKVPMQFIKATTKLDKSSYRYDDPLTLKITNLGTDIEFGNFYDIEIYNGSKWINVITYDIVTAILVLLTENQSYMQTIYLSRAMINDTGLYRIVKHLRASGSPNTTQLLYGEFNVDYAPNSQRIFLQNLVLYSVIAVTSVTIIIIYYLRHRKKR